MSSCCDHFFHAAIRFAGSLHEAIDSESGPLVAAGAGEEYVREGDVV